MSQDRHDEEHLYVEKYRSGGSGGGTASSITYDDSQTHLNANNVQQAIEKLDTISDYQGGQIETLSANKQNKLTAGTNISIDANNVISATGSGVVAEYESVNENLVFN